jgi:hypothetical protein
MKLQTKYGFELQASMQIIGVEAVENLVNFNRIPVMAPILAPILGVHFWGDHISLKNGIFCPLFSHDSSSFKGTCFLIRLIVLLDALYGPHLHCRSDLLLNCPFQLSFSWESTPARVKASGRGVKCYPRGDY